MKEKATKEQMPKTTHWIELGDVIESVSMQQSVEPQKIVNVLEEVIVEEFSEFLNLFEEDIVVKVNEQYHISVSLLKEAVDDVEDVSMEISLPEAQELVAEVKVGEKVEVPIDFSILNRKDVKHLDNLLRRKLQNIKNEVLYRDYKRKEGELINGVFLRQRGRDMYIDVGQVEACLSYRDQSPREKYKQGDKIKAYVKEVVLDESQRLNIYVSRTDPQMIRKLFELEVPELADGSVKIKDIVRDPGKKTKMSVYSIKQEVEPVGSCVGVSGIRIKAVIKELYGERIDVILYNENTKEFIGRAMQPAQVLSTLIINEAQKDCLVVVDDESYPFCFGARR